MLSMRDGTKIELWRYEPPGKTLPGVAFVFHGNGELIDYSLATYEWLASLGYRSYAMEYRGYGGSEGWARTSSLMTDVEDVLHYVETQERLEPQKILSFGVSVGTGLAAYLASLTQSHGLIMIAPYTSLKQVALTRPYLRHLVPFMWNEINTAQYVSALRDSCVIAAHGTADPVIGVENTERLASVVANHSTFRPIFFSGAGHLGFHTVREQLANAMLGCALTPFN